MSFKNPRKTNPELLKAEFVEVTITETLNKVKLSILTVVNFDTNNVTTNQLQRFYRLLLQ